MFDFEIPTNLEWRICRIPKPKKPGEYRKLTIPNDELKQVQRAILKYLYTVKSLKPSYFAHGFVPHRNTSTGVALHSRKADVFLCADVKDFFDNMPIDAVRKAMLKAGIGSQLTEKILKVCTYNNTLPQGGPCSPFLTNIGMLETDLMLSAFAQKRGFTYSRYADDITLAIDCAEQGKSVKRSYRHIFSGISKLLEGALGLKLNQAKSHCIRINSRSKRQITGVVVRKDGLGYNAPRKQRRTARAMLCNLAAKVRRQHNRLMPEDFGTWAKIVGYVRYFDNLRSYGEGSAATADPIIQDRYFNYLDNLIKETKNERNRSRHRHTVGQSASA